MQVEGQNSLPACCCVWAALILENVLAVKGQWQVSSSVALTLLFEKDLSQDLALGDDWQ